MIRREFDRLLPRAADAVALERSRAIAPAEARALRGVGYVRALQPA
jgi:hypothetical protein